jgi:DNA-binding FrmR family transcriptional regulator
MAYIAPTPPLVNPALGGNAVPWPGVLAGQTTGTITTFDHSIPLQNIAVQLSAIQAALNGGPAGEAVIPGGLLNILSSSATSLASIDGAMQLLITGGKEAVGANFSTAHSIQSSLSTIASLMSTMIALQSLSAADQINHNLFTQQTTNQGREEAQLKPIEVKPEAFSKQTQGTFAKIATINSQTSASGLLLEISTGALKSGLDISKDLIASTTVGQTFIGWGKDVKTYVTTQADAIKASADAKAAEVRKTTTGSKAGIK